MDNRWSGTETRLAFLLAIAAALALVPLRYFEALPSLCLFRNLAGFECPGCGMTRAILCILHGDFAKAWHFNRAVVVVFPLLCYISLTSRPWFKPSCG